jgi:hypothetical protein
MAHPLSRTLYSVLLAAAAAGTMAGCWPGYRPGGSQASYDEYTYVSTPDEPKTVKLLESTTNTTIWTVEVPIGKELVVKFYEDHDPKNTTRPTLMRWEIFEAGHEFGELHNAMPVPDAAHRRVDWFLRKNGTAVPAPEPAAAPK